jgi:hypothetical protein
MTLFCIVKNKYDKETIRSYGVKKFYDNHIYHGILFKDKDIAKKFIKKHDLSEDWYVRQYHGSETKANFPKPKPMETREVEVEGNGHRESTKEELRKIKEQKRQIKEQNALIRERKQQISIRSLDDYSNLSIEQAFTAFGNKADKIKKFFDALLVQLVDVKIKDTWYYGEKLVNSTENLDLGDMILAKIRSYRYNQASFDYGLVVGYGSYENYYDLRYRNVENLIDKSIHNIKDLEKRYGDNKFYCLIVKMGSDNGFRFFPFTMRGESLYGGTEFKIYRDDTASDGETLSTTFGTIIKLIPSKLKHAKGKAKVVDLLGLKGIGATRLAKLKIALENQDVIFHANHQDFRCVFKLKRIGFNENAKIIKQGAVILKFEMFRVHIYIIKRIEAFSSRWHSGEESTSYPSVYDVMVQQKSTLEITADTIEVDLRMGEMKLETNQHLFGYGIDIIYGDKEPYIEFYSGSQTAYFLMEYQ